MKRSLILMGGKTFVVSLPANWIKKHGLKKGQELEVNEDIGTITISAGALKSEEKAISIEYSSSCHEKLIKVYQLGYDTIKVTGKISNERLQQETNFLPGFEIISAGKGYSLLKCVSEPNNRDFDALLSRAFLLLPNDRKSALRLISMCKRCISKNGFKRFNESLVTYNLLCDMEKAALSHKPIKAGELAFKFKEMGFEDAEGIFEHPLQEMALARI
ncbi:MAG: hypothetical protein KJ955_05120 [Nanoarchaeota archaeon]|nr:hypothetical protein [Nanoarchaeota archaeon]